MNNDTILWANPELHDDLIKLFKKAFPLGQLIVTASYEPTCCVGMNYVFGYAGIWGILNGYIK